MIPDGVYMSLPNAVYQADRALGGGDHRDILANAVQWHGKTRNPTWRALHPPSDEETAAQRFGTALHCVALEPDTFDVRYFVAPAAPDMPKTKDEIGAALLKAGRTPPPTSKLKVEFEAAARLAGIKMDSDWQDELAIIANGREPISQNWYVALTALERVIMRHSKARQFITRGYSEVSVFYTLADGTRVKCRFDYLRIRTVCDVKSYMMREGMGAIDAFGMNRKRFAYNIAAAHYMDLRTVALPALVSDRKVFDGSAMTLADQSLITPALVGDLVFFEGVADFDKPSWWWLACSTNGVPEVDCVEFPTSLLAFAAADFSMREARRIYREFRDKFGEDDNEMWVADRGLVRLTDQSFSQAEINQGAVLYETATD